MEGSSSQKESRRVATALVATYHEAELATLVEHVADAIRRHHVGELGVHDVDETIHRYHKATRRLWSFCFGRGNPETVARTLEYLTEQDDRPDWWEEPESRRR